MRNAPVPDLDLDGTPSGVPAKATQAPTRTARWVGPFLLHELREILPPTIFFLVGFNPILLTTNLLLADYGEAFGGFMLVSAATLVVEKAVWLPTRCDPSAATTARRWSGQSCSKRASIRRSCL